MTKEITTTEWELIRSIRNYRNAYPNGERMMKLEIMDLVDELMSLEYNEEEDKDSPWEEK